MDRIVEFSANHWMLVSAFLTILSLLIYSFFSDTIQGIKSVGPTEATALLNHQDAVIIDIRETHEFNDGHILNAMHIPMASIDDRLKKLQKYKNNPVIISCQSGHRSVQACKQLRQHGFEDVYNLSGGVMAWRNANLPIQK